MAYISFEEVKEILKKSICETTSINEVLEKTVQFIYSKGYEDAKKIFMGCHISSCEGCKHNGLWENEYENGLSCPCLRCSRRTPDNYEPERRGESE